MVRGAAANECWCRALAQRRGRWAVGRVLHRGFPRRPSPHASVRRAPPAAPHGEHVAGGKAGRELVLGVVRAKGGAAEGVGCWRTGEDACASSGSLRRRAASSALSHPARCCSALGGTSVAAHRSVARNSPLRPRTEVLPGQAVGQDGLQSVAGSCGV
jgi:hypothetical protein